jgi:inosose dehydratase
MGWQPPDDTMTRRSVLLAAPMALVGAVSIAPRAAGSPPIGFCVGTYGMKDLPIDEAVRLIARTGYDGVELSLMPEWQCDPAKMSDGDRRRLRALLDETRLAVAALNEALLITAESRTRNLERLQLAADLAHYLAPGDPPVIETMLGGRTVEWAASKQSIVDELGSWAQLAERHDVTVCFKPHAGHAIHNPARALETLRLVGSARLKICYDYCHMFVASESLESSLRALAPSLGFITLKDARWTDTGHQFLLPGDGDTDYLLYFRLLKELGYRGWVAAEVTAMIWRMPGYDPAAAAHTAYANIAPFWRVAGLDRPSRKPDHIR